MRIPKRFTSHFINWNFFYQYLQYNRLSDINMGRCYDWAYFAYRLFPNVILWSTDYHAWVQVNDHFYDSETKRGVKNFLHLQCNARNSFPDPWDLCPPEGTTKLNDFTAFWDLHGGGARHHWDSKLESALMKVMGPKYKKDSPILHCV